MMNEVKDTNFFKQISLYWAYRKDWLNEIAMLKNTVQRYS